MPTRNKVILEILKKSKDDDRIKYDGKISQILVEMGLTVDDSGYCEVTREIRLELVKEAIMTGCEFEEVISHITWKDFEGFVAEVLAENGYDCVESFRRRGDGKTKGMEIDVIGFNGRILVSVDAKMWGVRTGKSSALASAASKQYERSKRLTKMGQRLAEKISIEPGNYAIYPILVTWLIEDIKFVEGVPIVPITNFNSFIRDLDMYRDYISIVDFDYTEER